MLSCSPLASSSSIFFSAAPTVGVTLPAYRRLEEGLARNFPDWDIRVDPPRTDLPPIEFAAESASLEGERQSLVADLAWAFQRWGVTQVEVVAFLPSASAAQSFSGSSLGHRRADAVMAELVRAGIAASVAGEYRAAGSSPGEREAAARRANQVVIRPAS